MARKPTEDHLPLFDDLLRPYQRECIIKVRESFRRGNKAVMMVLPTGTGKTRTFCILPRDGARVMIVCAQEELVSQTQQSIRSLRKRVASLEQRINVAELGDEWIVASYQTLCKNDRYKRLLGHIDLLVIDECDDKFSIKFREMATDFINHGARVLGVTATPFRGDKSNLFGFYEDCPYSMELMEAFNQGWLVKPRVFVHRVKSVALNSIAKKGLKDFAPDELDRILTHEQCLHDVANLIKEHSTGHHMVAFTNSVKHSQMLAQVLDRYGMKASCVWGTMNPADRKEQLEKFVDGTHPVIVNCNVLGRGWDCPEVTAIFNARPTKSKARYFQALGRGTRAFGCDLSLPTAEERLAAIAASPKPTWMLHDITNTCRFHQPITAITALLNAPKEFLQKVEDKAGDENKDKSLEELDEDLQEAINEHKEQERLAREEEKKRRAKAIMGVTFESSERDLFDRPDVKSPFRRTYRFIFGKYRGMPLDSPEVPDSYMEWLCSENGRLTDKWRPIYEAELRKRRARKQQSA